jgi:hypothetical protein
VRAGAGCKSLKQGPLKLNLHYGVTRNGGAAMEMLSLLIIFCLCIMPIGAVLNLEIEKPGRKKCLQPQGSPKTPIVIGLLNAPESSTTPTGKKPA